MKHNIVVNPTLLTESFGLESIAAFSDAAKFGSPAEAMKRVIGDFGTETVAKLNSMLSGVKKPLSTSDHIEDAVKLKIYNTDTDAGCHRLATECVQSTKRYSLLPAEVRDILKPLKNMHTKVKNAISGLTPETPFKTRAGLEFREKQISQAMESTLFGIFAGVEAQQRIGMEAYSYQQTIFYPKLEANLQWINVASTIYPKMTKIKTLLNEQTSIPVHWQSIWFTKVDENNNVIAKVRREELYNDIDPTANKELAKFFTLMEKKLTIPAKFFNQRIELQKTEVYNPENALIKADGSKLKKADLKDSDLKPFLKADELIRSDFYVSGLLIDGNEEVNTKRIHDYKSGKTIAETMSEVDYKGKIIPIQLDPKKADEIYYLGILFEGDELAVTVTCTKSKDSMPNLEAIEFEFKLHDPYNHFNADLDIEVRTERTFINAGTLIKREIPMIQSELEIINARQGGDYFAKLTNLTAENVAHYKDMVWFKGYMAMKDELKAAFKADSRYQLYASQKIDLDISAEVDKVQALHFNLGPAFQSLLTNFNVAANTTRDTQLNMFCSTYHLDVIGGNLQLITGTVNEESNGEFMGVAQEYRSHVMTIGTDTSTPISSIVVGTDKDGIRANVYKDKEHPENGYLNPNEVEYGYHVIPYYKDTNLETSLFVETPTRIISDPNYRSARRVLTPNMMMWASGKWQTMRAAAGDFTVKGWHIHVLPTIR